MVTKAFGHLDQFSQEIEVLRNKALSFQNLEDLFELEVTKYKELRNTQMDIRKLTKLWEVIKEIYAQYDKWNKILWKNIHTDVLLVENEKFVQQLKQLPREIKNLLGFGVIMEKVTNIKKAINCIDMLGSEAMEPRHWE